MNQEEKTLRYNIRHLIKHVKQKKLNEEKKFRSLLNKLLEHEMKIMLSESEVPDVDPAPNKSTGINVLEELLKKIVPVLETDYKSLTTSNDQRQSFRAHISNAIIQTLTPAKANNDAGDQSAQSQELQEIDLEIEEDVAVNIDDNDAENDKFIDIRTDAERAAEEEPEEEDPRGDFGSDVGGDETGRNMAYQCFKKIENNIIDSYELLANPEDQELFFDYLLANVKMYFDKFEKELDPVATEPDSQAYDQAKQQDTTTSNTADSDEFDLEI